ncbi:hypothetical protein SEVIR_2G276000v4 [Setaria viridis]|uniref:Nucleotide-diphospho-sugar transferase domain-containing protein n=1 Tax=Setaria viridis TaxID=4556 RepID=A0A4V6DBG5_SETVI|nr:uncharacterized protein At4g15970-like isoform X2 [Setaria viridis]TKW33996.1 hypothetical protein SEVIR_2G276000v2 [Setaria viridis]
MAAPRCSKRDLLGFFLGAAVTAACVVLLQPAAPCPCGLVPLAETELAAFGNETAYHAPPRPCSLVGVAPADRQELVALGNGTAAHADPCTTKPGGMDATSPDDNLPELLRRAAMEDNTVIMTFTNGAFASPNSLLDLFLHSFRVGVRTAPLLRHLIIVAVDDKAYGRCRHVHPHCYALAMGATNFTGEQRFMARDYLDMMWRRNRFQARVLRLGYSFVFTDVDIVWFRNPLLRIPVGADLAMSCDKFYGDNPYDLDKWANGGFVYARASARTVAFYESWYQARGAHPGKNEQDLFDMLKRELSARHGVAAQFVDTAYLGGFCDRRKGRDFNKLCTYHANCLVGMKLKLRRLTQVFAEWNKFRASAALTD